MVVTSSKKTKTRNGNRNTHDNLEPRELITCDSSICTYALVKEDGKDSSGQANKY